MSQSRPLILDVDTGTDDAIALMMAGLAPELDLIGCTTVWGNHPVEMCTDNTLRVLDLIGRSDVAVHPGLSKPFAPIPFRFDDHVDAERELIHPSHFPVANASRPAADLGAVEWLLETPRATTRQLTLVPVAPLTNIAAAVTIDPSIVDAVEEIVIMGGGHALGNATPTAEANIWHDPVAAEVVLQAGFERLVLVPLDATHRAIVSADQVQALAEIGTSTAAAAAALIGQRITGYSQDQPMEVPDAAPVHDALCIAYLLDPSVVDLHPFHVAVETTGAAAFGTTLIDVVRRSRRPVNARVALDADADLFNALLHRVLTGPTTSHVTPHLSRLTDDQPSPR